MVRLLEKLGYTKLEASWILYDVANSMQVLMTMTVLFPLLVKAISPGEHATVFVGMANTIFSLIIAVFSQFVGAIADVKGFQEKIIYNVFVHRYSIWNSFGSAVFEF